MKSTIKMVLYIILAFYSTTLCATTNLNYPNYNISPLPADSIGVQSTAAELALKINIGWNVGNSLEAIGSETSWGNPRVSAELIDLVKKSGFNAIRIPCAWNQFPYLSPCSW